MIEAVEVKIPICKRGSDGQNREKIGARGLVGEIEDVGVGDSTGRTLMNVAVSNLTFLSRALIIP